MKLPTDTDMLTIVVVPPTVSVPVVVKFSLLKLMAPDESVMDPAAIVKVPGLYVPDVVRFSLPKLIAPDESVIDPLASVRLPKVDPVARCYCSCC